MKSFKILDNIKSYCDKASIGVLKYMSRRTMSKSERIFWVFCIIFSLLGSIFLIKETIEKFLAHKVSFKISDKRYEVTTVPFPAIAICPELLISQSDVDKLSLKAHEQLQWVWKIKTKTSLEIFRLIQLHRHHRYANEAEFTGKLKQDFRESQKPYAS